MMYIEEERSEEAVVPCMKYISLSLILVQVCYNSSA